MQTQCKYCGREDEGNAGDYYHQKECEARHLVTQLNDKKASLSPEQLAELRRRLEIARDTGD